MANLIAGRSVVPELIQDDFTPQRVADAVMPLLGPDGDAMRGALTEVRRRLGDPGASGRAAGVVMGLLSGQKKR
jgi:lipid-A-disaccharide synthase